MSGIIDEKKRKKIRIPFFGASIREKMISLYRLELAFDAALHHAADMGHTEVVGDLIIGGANVQRVDNRGYTPAHLASAAGHVDVIEKLLGAGLLRPSLRFRKILT